jgi:hypothetical protein
VTIRARRGLLRGDETRGFCPQNTQKDAETEGLGLFHSCVIYRVLRAQSDSCTFGCHGYPLLEPPFFIRVHSRLREAPSDCRAGFHGHLLRVSEGVFLA